MKITLKKEEAVSILAKHLHVSLKEANGACSYIYDLWLRHGLFDSYFSDPNIKEIWLEDEIGVARRYWEIYKDDIHNTYLKYHAELSICDCFEPSFIP